MESVCARAGNLRSKGDSIVVNARACAGRRCARRAFGRRRVGWPMVRARVGASRRLPSCVPALRGHGVGAWEPTVRASTMLDRSWGVSGGRPHSRMLLGAGEGRGGGEGVRFTCAEIWARSAKLGHVRRCWRRAGVLGAVRIDAGEQEVGLREQHTAEESSGAGAAGGPPWCYLRYVDEEWGRPWLARPRRGAPATSEQSTGGWGRACPTT